MFALTIWDETISSRVRVGLAAERRNYSMGNISRRDFLAMAAVLGAEAAWGRSFSAPSKISWRERRDLFPEGVASGDPDSNSVLLWTRRAPQSEPQPKPAQELGAELTV